MSKETRIGFVSEDFGVLVLRKKLTRNDAGDWGTDPQEDYCGVIRSTNFTNEGILDLTDVARRSLSESKRRDKTLQEGDIIIERSGGSENQPVGRVGYITAEIGNRAYSFSNFVQRISLDSTVNPKFVFFCLQRMHEMGATLGMQTQTTGIRNLDYKYYLRSLLPAPDRKEQDRIVTALETVDGAIAAVRESVAKAGRLLKALMQQLLTGRLMPDGSPRQRGDFYEGAKLGFVPKGWIECRVRQIASKVTDGEHVTPRRVPKGFYLLSARNVGNGRLLLDDVDYVDEPELLRIRKRCDPEPNDLLISCSGTIGNACLVPEGMQCALVRSAALVKFQIKKCNPKFMEWLFRATPMQRQMHVASSVSIQGNLFQGSIRRLWLMLPQDVDEQAAIAAKLSTVERLILGKEQKIVALQRLKTSLMQSLLTGRVRLAPKGDVKEAIA